jgi:uncharacterized protein
VVTLGAHDLPALRRFYGRLRWAELEGSDDNWAAYLLGGVVLALFPESDLDAETNATTSGRGGFTLAANVDHREDVDTAWEAAIAAGAAAIGPPEDRDWGGRSAYMADPEGNRWEIAWAPGAVFGPHGEVIRFG